MKEQPCFEQLNSGWNADPNAPELSISVDNADVTITFFLNTFAYHDPLENDAARIVFHDCCQYRCGAPNDEGFFVFNQSRYKQYGVEWGEFYQVHHSDWQSNFPAPIKIGSARKDLNHYLFYFKDETFECIASSYEVQFYKTAP